LFRGDDAAVNTTIAGWSRRKETNLTPRPSPGAPGGTNLTPCPSPGAPGEGQDGPRAASPGGRGKSAPRRARVSRDWCTLLTMRVGHR
jgi:hypothetical protein